MMPESRTIISMDIASAIEDVAPSTSSRMPMLAASRVPQCIAVADQKGRERYRITHTSSTPAFATNTADRDG